MLRINLDKLQTLLNQLLIYQGIPCQVIEILREEPALVLRDARREQTVIQPNQYGDAGPRVPQTFTVSLFDASGQRLNPDLAELPMVDLLIDGAGF